LGKEGPGRTELSKNWGRLEKGLKKKGEYSNLLSNIRRAEREINGNKKRLMLRKGI